MDAAVLLALLPLAAPARAAARTAMGPNLIAARRVVEAARPSPMALRFATPSGKEGPSPVPSPPQTPPPPAPRAPSGPFGPGITPPPAGPQPAFDRWRTAGAWTAAPAAEAPDEPPARSIREEALAAFGPAAGGAPPAAPAVTRLGAGQTGRNFGGASDPVIFLTGGGSIDGAGGGGAASDPGNGRGRSTDPAPPPGQAK